MQPALQEINELYLRIPNYIDPSPEYIESLRQRAELAKGLSEEERKALQLEFERQINEASRIYNIAIEKFKAVSPSLSPAETIEAYEEGCKLLQRNLSGHMCYRFDSAYIPLMMRAIQNDESHSAFMFLQTLADHVGKEIAPLVLNSLDSQSRVTREAAISVAYELRLHEAVPQIRKLVEGEDPEIAEFALRVLTALESKTS